MSILIIEITLVNNSTPSLVLRILNVRMIKILELIIYTWVSVLNCKIIRCLIFLLWLFLFSKIIKYIFNFTKLFLNWRFLQMLYWRFRLHEFPILKFIIKYNQSLISHLILIWGIWLILINLNRTSIKNIICVLLIYFLNSSDCSHIYLRSTTNLSARLINISHITNTQTLGLFILEIVIFLFLYIGSVSPYDIWV